MKQFLIFPNIAKYNPKAYMIFFNLTYGKSQEHIFMGRDFGHQRDYSEQVAFEIDEEVKSIVDKQYSKVLELLSNNRDILDALSHELLEKETMDADEFIESVNKIKDRRNFA